MKRTCSIFTIIVFLSAISGCATNRGILDIQLREQNNSDNGKKIKITRVSDLRIFELKPDEPSIPSLKDGQIDNSTITSRAIARKRNGFGKAWGDILLPEGRTVEDLVRDAVSISLREQGYFVLNEYSSGGEYDNALPVEVDIQQFWAWFSPGFWAAKLQFEAIIDISGKGLLDEGKQTVRGYVKLNTQAANTRAWTNTIMKGLEDLIRNIKEKVYPA